MLVHKIIELLGVRSFQPDTAVRRGAAKSPHCGGPMHGIAFVEKYGVWHGRVVVLLRIVHARGPLGLVEPDRRDIAAAR